MLLSDVQVFECTPRQRSGCLSHCSCCEARICAASMLRMPAGLASHRSGSRRCPGAWPPCRRVVSGPASTWSWMQHLEPLKQNSQAIARWACLPAHYLPHTAYRCTLSAGLDLLSRQYTGAALPEQYELIWKGDLELMLKLP